MFGNQAQGLISSHLYGWVDLNERLFGGVIGERIADADDRGPLTHNHRSAAKMLDDVHQKILNSLQVFSSQTHILHNCFAISPPCV